MLFAGLGAPTSLLFLFSYLTLVLSSPRSFLLPQTLWQIWQELSSLFCSIRIQWVPGHSFLPETMQLTRWSDREHYSCSLQSLVVSLLLFLVFIRTRSVLSHQNSFTHRFPRFPPRNLCSLVTLAVFSLVFAVTDTAFCLALISLGLVESRILSAVGVDTRPRTPLISFCTVQLRTLCTARSLVTIFLRPLALALGSCPASGAPWSSAMPHPLEGVE